MGNLFLKPAGEYTRNLNVVGTAHQDAAHFLQIHTGEPLDRCLAYVKKATSTDGRFPINSRSMKVTKRNAVGDRVKALVSFDELLSEVEECQDILTPNLIVYDSPMRQQSCTSKYIEDKMESRTEIKDRGIQAKMENDKGLMTICSNAEAGIKEMINSLSGAHASPYNPFFNKTSHSSLTSLCRVATNYSNSSTERFLSGNRHYRNLDVTIGNIVAVTRQMDYAKLAAVVDRYELHTPTTDELMTLVLRCTKFYWSDVVGETKIRTTLERLTPLQRIAFAYTGDFYHLDKMNPELTHALVKTLITRPTAAVANPEEIVKNVDSDIKALVGILCKDLLDGGTVKAMRAKSEDNYVIYAATIQNVIDTLEDRLDLIKVLWLGEITLPSIWYYPDSIRRSVVGGDTDSTLFTVQDWVINWIESTTDLSTSEVLHSTELFNHEAYSVGAVMVYLNSQLISNTLASMSKQIGVVDSKLFEYRMKCEFYFAVYMRANRAKHYATLETVREGNVYPEPEIGIKGVGLKDSKMPDKIMQGVQSELENIMINIMNGKGIEPHALFQRIANLEHEIINSLKSGNIEYLSIVGIKQAEAYKVPMSSNYAHHSRWDDVFSSTFGKIGNPPYASVKISTTLSTTRKTREWVASLEPKLQTDMNEWLTKYNKTSLGTILLPKEIVAGGIPDIFVKTIDIRKVVSELVAAHYIILEMCGFYLSSKNNTTLLSDTLAYCPEIGLPGTQTEELK